MDNKKKNPVSKRLLFLPRKLISPELAVLLVKAGFAVKGRDTGKNCDNKHVKNKGGHMKKAQNKEICNECGRSVKWGSGLYVNRVLDLNDYETRVKMGKPFPEGEYICRECEEKINNE